MVRLGVVLALGLTLASGAASAQTDAQLASRRVLLDQAEAARTAGDHARALQMAQEAIRIQSSASLRAFVAEEQLALGQTAAALGSADACAREAERDTGARNRDVILARCRGLVAQLRAVVGSVVVHVPGSSPTGAEVTVGGAVLDPSLYNLPYVVSAGHVIVEAHAPGYAPIHQEVDVAAGALVDVPVTWSPGEATHASGGPGEVPATSAAPSSAPVEASTAPSSSAPSAAPEPVEVHPSPPAASGGTHLPLGGIVVAGVGVVGLIAGGIFAIVRANAIADCTEAGGVLQCPSSEMDRVNGGYSTFTIATDVALGVGGAALVGGALWLILGRHTDRPASHTRIDIVPAGHGAALLVGRTF